MRRRQTPPGWKRHRVTPPPQATEAKAQSKGGNRAAWVAGHVGVDGRVASDRSIQQGEGARQCRVTAARNAGGRVGEAAQTEMP